MRNLACRKRRNGSSRRTAGSTSPTSLEVDGKRWRFRVNVLQQMGHMGLVARRVNNKIPDFEGLHLPPIAGRAVQVRPGDDSAGGHHRLGQEHHHRLDARLDQPPLPQAHPHAGRPDRVHLHRRQVPDQPARDRHGREGLHDRHEARRARRPGRDAGGRNARPGDVRDGDPGGRDRAPGVRHDPRLDRAQHDRPHPRPVSRRTCTPRSAARWSST